MFRGNLQGLCPIASGPVTGHNWKDLDSVFTHSLDQTVFVIEVLIKFPWDFSSLTWTGQSLSAFPYRREASVPLPSSCFHWPVYSRSMPCTEGPRTGPNTPALSSAGLSRGEGSPALTHNHPLWLRILLTFSAARVHCWLIVMLLPTSLPSCFPHDSFPDDWCAIYTGALFDLCEVPLRPFLQVVEVCLEGSMTLWHISHFSQFCVICKFAEETLCPVIPIVMKMW